MCIYCGTNNYRKIYENHHGPITKDDTGRTMEVHHIDGNHSNNSPDNLTLLTIREHYDVHYSQGDWHACIRISQRLEISPQERFTLTSNATKAMFAKGTHPFLDGEMSKKVQRARIEDGTHHLLSGEIQSKTQERLVREGRHNFKKEGFISSSKIRVSCTKCKREVGLSGFTMHSKACSP